VKIVANNGDIIKFVKQKDYIMINSNLGQGSFGKTVLLRDPFIDELFVAKKYEPEYPDIKQEFFQSFLQEIKILYKLNHPNIVRVFNYYPYENITTGYILMEYIEGQNIEEFICAYHPFDNRPSLDDIFSQLIEGFNYIEKHLIVHRDIREGNILVDNSGILKIIDFGLGKIIRPVETTEDSMAEIINRSGLDRLPNEYRTGTYDSKTDMFYLGELFNRLLVKSNNSDFFTYQQILNRMMELNPVNRYESFADIANAIGKKDFANLEITEEDRRIYQSFANAIYSHLSIFKGEKRFNHDVIKFIKRLNDVIIENCFEDVIQDNSDLISTIVACAYRYNPTKEIECDTIREFKEWICVLSPASQQLVLNNIIAKLSMIKVDSDDELPF
jgi:serine/threonine protein kinase